MSSTTNTQSRTTSMRWLLASAVLGLIGLIAWIAQMSYGMQILGLGQSVVWGVYIALFFVLAGAGSGLVLTAALSHFGVMASLRPLQRDLMLMGLGALIAGGLTILVDVGRPERVANLILSPNPSSMFVWDFIGLALLVIAAAASLFFGAKWKWLYALAAAAAISVIVIEGWILTVSAGRPFWHNPLIPVTFVVEAFVAAGSVGLLIRNHAAVSGILSRVVSFLLGILLVFGLVEAVTMIYAGDPDGQKAFMLLTQGNLAPLYWGQIGLGVLLPLALLTLAKGNRTAVILAAVLAILGIFASKLSLLIAGQAFPFLQGTASYVPSGVEFAAGLGLLGIAAMAYFILNRLVPARESS